MKMYVAGRWLEKTEKLEVLNPFDNTVIDTVPRASMDDVDHALSTAREGAIAMRKISGYDRFLILKKAAELLEQYSSDLARIITLEEGKIISEARFEVSRAVQTLTLSAEEAKRVSGEMVPLDGAPGAGNRMGFTLRIPCGVVVAISPFNFPLNLVASRLGGW